MFLKESKVVCKNWHVFARKMKLVGGWYLVIQAEHFFFLFRLALCTSSNGFTLNFVTAKVRYYEFTGFINYEAYPPTLL